MTMELGTTPTNLKDTLVVTSPMPRVSLTFFGKGRGLLKLKIRPPLLQLNMVNARVGENIVMVPITNIFDKDQDISITKTSIREITLKVDEKAAKDIIPSIITQGQPKPGFALREIRSSAKVRVTGAKSQLQYLREIRTEPLVLNNRAISYARTLALVPPQSGYFTLTPCSVLVEVLIEDELQRVFTNAAVHKIAGAGILASIEPAVVESLVLAGPRSLVVNSTPEDFSITIDLRGKAKGVYSLPAEIRLPKNLKLVASKPQLFKVSIR